MAYINDLLEQRKKLIDDARSIVERAEAEKRGLSDEENTNWTKAITDADKLSESINAARRQAELDRGGSPRTVVRQERAGRVFGRASAVRGPAH